jgi:FKBP-type peptidyl-prolyl cis-trans isomerase
MRKASLTILAVFVLVIAGCGGSSDSTSSSSSSEATTGARPFHLPPMTPPIREEAKMNWKPGKLLGPEIKAIIPNSPPPTTLFAQDLAQGIGNFSKEGSRLTIQYVAYEYDSKKKLESSWETGKPFTFTLGKGEVNKGWEIGMQEFEVGDRRELILPPKYTKGPPTGGKASPNATLVYVADLLASESEEEIAAKKEAKESKESGGEPEGPVTQGSPQPQVMVPKGPVPKTYSEHIVRAGSGPTAEPGDEVTVNYVGVVYNTGKQFDSSWVRGEPFTFTLGGGEVIPGWEQGIKGMQVGERREMIIPPEMAYGPKQVGPIPPNSTLIFVVDLLSVKKPK